MGFFDWVLAVFLGGIISNFVIKRFAGNAINKELLREGYAQGYWDASINLRMYFHLMDKTIPPSDWLRSTMGRRLDTRDKFITLMETDEKGS
tara:strand:+ start:521 stop:796 length:276 start_codon:yes stop_codon:yes gene_type:complete